MKIITSKLIRTSTRSYLPKYAWLLLAFAVFACKSPDDLDLELDLNEFPSDTIVIDNLPIQTVREEALRTDNINFQVLGSINDSIYGPSKASIYTQLSLNGAINFPINTENDSAILELSFIDYYGDLGDPFDVGVYLLAEEMDQSTDYYNTSEVALGDKVGSIKNFKLKANDGKVRIDVSKLWGSGAFVPGNEYSLTSAFQQDFYGLAIIPESVPNLNQGAMYYLNLVSLESALNVYYHYFETSGSKLDRIEAVAELQFQTDAESFSNVTHNYENTFVDEYLKRNEADADRAFVQALGGTYATINISALKSLADSPAIAIHKAELIMPCDCELHDPFLSPIPFLDIRAKTEDGSFEDLPDKSKVYWVRAYNSEEQAYIFNITNHAQQVLNSYRFVEGYEDLGLAIKAVKNEPIPFSAGRFVVKGSAAQRTDGSYLRIFYSKIDLP